MINDQEIFLKAFDRDFKSIEVTEKIKIIGVVIGTIKSFIGIPGFPKKKKIKH